VSAHQSEDLSRRAFLSWLTVILIVGGLLRGLFLTADPPWQSTVGITWHDEGPWVHNARNKVLFGQWSLDQWNPMYLAPVFTGLEWLSFSAFGVGTWQARLVSVAMGLISVLTLACGLNALAGRRTALVGAALIATSYVYVMWDRAALMEATMVAFIVASWSAYACARTRPMMGAVAGVAALLAFFTKAAAAFFVAALAFDALFSIAVTKIPALNRGSARTEEARAGYWTLAGLALGGLVALAVFVVPFWTEFQFYNWQMSVTRKPSYSVKAFLDRASWVPIVHDFFTRQYLVTVLALASCAGLVARWFRAAASERLLGFWIGLGLVELIFHDVGNERRFIFFIPAMAALAALVLGRDRRLVPINLANLPWRARVLAMPAVLYGLYVIAGAIVRLPFLYQVQPGVRLAAVVAVLASIALILWWRRILTWLSAGPWPVAACLTIVGVVVAGDLVQFSQWAAARTYKNIDASRLVGTWLAPGTPVHGKLANGLALENRIKPVFVGRGFGNYADRASRPDIRYVLTYVTPRIGYEGPVIADVLAAHPGWRVMHTFPVAETPGGIDRAALIEKP
jgi:4-amino-4-deoxy-L-arabinose transferase-like glycosyltransferase